MCTMVSRVGTQKRTGNRQTLVDSLGIFFCCRKRWSLVRCFSASKSPPYGNLFMGDTFVKNKNTCKALFLAAPVGVFHSSTPARELLLATCKRGSKRSHGHLVLSFILFQLILDGLRNFLRILSCRIYIEAPAPKFPLPIFVPQFRVLLIYHQATLPFQTHNSLSIFPSSALCTPQKICLRYLLNF